MIAMSEIGRFFLHQPIFAGLVSLCLMVVAGLILSDWAEKRRTRALLRLRDQLKAAHQQGRKPESPSFFHIGTVRPKPVFRIFRWEFVALSVVAVVFIAPLAQKPLQVRAKSAPESVSPGSSKSDIANLSGQSDLAFGEEVTVTFRCPSPEPSLYGISFHLPISELADPQVLWPGFNSKTREIAISADLVASFDYSSGQSEWDAVQDSVRPDYFASESGVAFPSYDRRGRFARR